MKTTDRGIFRALRAEGVPNNKIPKQFRDHTVKRGKKDKLGQIVVKSQSGVVSNPASRTLKQFETNVGGQEEIAEKLQALPDTNKNIRALAGLLRENSRKSLARLVAECDLAPTEVMTAYARGCIELAKVDAAIEAHRNLNPIVKDLVRHALDQEGLCENCLGTGTQRGKSTDHKETQPCVLCSGTGRSYKSSKHKEFATRQLLEITKSVQEKAGPTINLNQNVGIKVGSGGNFFEKVVGAADEALYGRGKGQSSEVIEAEVVEKEEKDG